MYDGYNEKPLCGVRTHHSLVLASRCRPGATYKPLGECLLWRRLHFSLRDHCCVTVFARVLVTAELGWGWSARVWDFFSNFSAGCGRNDINLETPQLAEQT